MKKRNKILLIIAGIFIILGVIGYYYANSLIQRVIRRELNSIKLEQKDNYHIEVGEINVRILLRSFVLKDVNISTNKSNLTDHDRSFEIELKKLVVKVSDFKSVLTDGELIVKDIELDRPRIDLVLPASADTSKSKVRSRFKSDRLSKVVIGNFAIHKGEFYLHKKENDSLQLITSVNKLDFQLSDIIVKVKEEAFSDIISFNELHLTLGELEYHDAEMHAFSAKNVHLTNQKKGITFEKIFFRNRESLDDFTKKTNDKGVWSNTEITDVLLHINIEKLKDKSVIVENIDIKKLDLELFQYQTSEKSDPLKYSEFLAKLKIPIIVDTFNIRDATLNLSLKKANSSEIDDYQLKDLALELLHFSNDSLYLAQHPNFNGFLQSNLWTNTQLNAVFSLDPNDIDNSISLNIDNIPQRKIKKYIKEFKLGIYRSGKINQIDFNFISDSNKYSGNTRLAIQDLDFRFNKFQNDAGLKQIDTKIKSLTLSANFTKENKKAFVLSVDTIDIESPRVSILGKQENNNNAASRKPGNFRPKINIDLFKISNATFSYEKPGANGMQFNIKKASMIDRSISIDLSKSGNEQLINSGNFSINFDGISFSKAPSNFIEINTISIDKSNDEINIIGIRYESNSSKNNFLRSSTLENEYISAYLEKVSIELDLHRNLFDPIQCEKITLVHPILTYIKAFDRKGNSNEEENKDKNDFPISVDEIEILNADIEIIANTDRKKEAKIIELKQLNGSIKNFSTEKNRKLLASIESSFFDNSKLKLNIDFDQGTKNAAININGNIKDLSLKTVKNRMSIFTELNYSDGNLDEIEFSVQASKSMQKGNVTIKTINVDHFKTTKDKDADWLQLSIDQVALSFSKKKEQKLTIIDLNIKKPLVEIHHVVKFKNKENSISDDKKDLFADKDLNNSTLHIAKFTLEDGIVHQFDGDGKLDPLTSIEHIHLAGNRIDLYDSTQSKMPISVNGLDLSMKNIIVHSIPKHDMSIGSVELNLQKKKLIIKNLDFRNKNTPEIFFSQLSYRKAWMDLSVDEVEIDINFREVFSAHPRLGRATINNAKFITHVNLALEVGPEEKYFPNHSLVNSKFPFTIDSIFVNNGQIDVLFRDEVKHGLLQFNDITAKVSNLTSDPITIKKNNEMVWIMDATLYESGKTHIEVNYSMDKEDDDFSMIGTVTDLNLTDTDTLTKNLYGIRVSDGIAHKIYLDISGDKYEAAGIVQFDYEELHVNLDKKKKNIKDTDELKKVKKKDKLNESFVKNVIVNGLLRKKNMPDNGKYIEFGDAYYKRETNKPIFNLMWFTISSGMLNVAESGVIRGIQNIKLNKKDKGNK